MENTIFGGINIGKIKKMPSLLIVDILIPNKESKLKQPVSSTAKREFRILTLPLPKIIV